MARTRPKPGEPTIVKKYANRRLYDTGRSSYVTLDDLCTMVKEGHDFVVQDAKSGEDLTRQVLTQIIVDQESKGENLLPESFLKQLIGFYGDSLQGVVPGYLEETFQAFVKNQEEFRSQMNESFGQIMPQQMMGSMDPMNTLEDMKKRNVALFEQAMKTWTPFMYKDKKDS